MDKIDSKLLEIVESISGATVHDILQQARDLRSDTQLRKRLDALSIQGYIDLDRQSEVGRVFAIITPYGRETLAEGRNAAQPTEAERQ
jgi:hypothetical protein